MQRAHLLAQRGDEESFNELVRRWERPIFALAYRVLGREEDARDVCQETFLRAWRRRETYAGRASLRAWLYRIATNACLDLLAKCRPEPATGGEVRWLQPYPDKLLDELPSEEDEPDAVVVWTVSGSAGVLIGRVLSAVRGRSGPAA